MSIYTEQDPEIIIRGLQSKLKEIKRLMGGMIEEMEDACIISCGRTEPKEHQTTCLLSTYRNILMRHIK